MTGASVSSRAVLRDMQGAANLAMKEIFGKPVPAEKTASLAAIYFSPRMIALMAVLLLGLSLRFFKSNRWLKWTVFALSVGIIGFWLKTPFSLPHIFQIASLQLPFQSNAYLIIVGGFVVVTTIFWGPLWCVYLCPYAALQEFVVKLGQNNRWRPGAKTIKFARELRWVTLFAALLLYFPLKIRSGAEIEPFFHLFSQSLTAAGLLLVAVTLTGSFFIPRFWCRFFCPTGACLILLSSHRKYFRRVEQGIENSRIDSSDSD